MVFYMADWIDSFHLGVYIDFISGVSTAQYNRPRSVANDMMMTMVLNRENIAF